MINEEKRIFFENLKNSLTEQDVISFLQTLGVNNYENKSDYLIFPTICHNVDVETASLKLYYYKSNKLFHCYTDCGESFDIFGLIKRYCDTRQMSQQQYKEIIKTLLAKKPLIRGNSFDELGYIPLSEKFKKKEPLTLKTFPDAALSPFIKYYTYEWLNEGITPESMDKFNILYSISQNKIIIPHYNENSELIGIRGRALNPEDIEKGKYRPVTIQGITYAHPLSLNLYGLNINKDNISKRHCAIVFEGEKSVLLMDKYYPQNIAVASCGSNFHKAQLKLLLNKNVSEIIIAYDKENITTKDNELYFNKLYNMCDKYKHYCNFSFIFDREGLLSDKDSPIDKGQDVFEYLLSKRVRI